MHKNENRPGYKKTKVGWIPEGWDVAPICKTTSYADYRGKTPPKSSSGRFLVTAKNIQPGYINYENSKEYIPEETYEAVMSRGIPKIGDVLITTEAPLGNIASIDREDIALAQRVIKYRANPERLTGSFLKHFMMGPVFQTSLDKEATGGTVKGIKGSRLHKLPLVLPSLPEQEAIAEVLECWDKGIRTLENKLVKKRLIKKGLMQKLLSGQIRLSGFSKPWKNVRLGEVLTEHKENGSGKEEVHSVSVHKGVINQVEHLGRSFSAKDTTNYNLVKPGDIIYTKSPTGDFPLGIIKQCMLTKTAIVSPLYGVFTPMTKHLGLMLHCFFDSPVNTGNYLRPIIQKGAKNTINITNTTFLSGKMTLPLDKEEQRAIAEVLAAADRELEALERKLALWKNQKKFLLNNLVTGTVRLPAFAGK